jgi:hypothetical protein
MDGRGKDKGKVFGKEDRELTEVHEKVRVMF